MVIFNKINFLSPSKGQRIVTHLLFWLLFFIVRFYLNIISFNVYSGFPTGVVLLLSLFNIGLIAGVFYILTMPVWNLIKRGHRAYATILIVSAVITYALLDAGFEQFILHYCSDCLLILKNKQPAYYGLLESGFINILLKRLLSLGTPFILLLTLTIPLCLKLALNSWRSQVRALQLAKANIELEFNFLKAQINPHFLFNTLNNIYGLILKEDTTRSAGLVARLSELLRYMLYETNKKHMPLSGELKILNDYMELEKVRLNDTLVTADIRTDATDYQVPPLLLLPLVENAFKFCSDERGACIQLLLEVLKGQLRFTLENTIDPDRLVAVTSGIGLSNFRKRLELYYPDRYRYEEGLQNDVYSVHLLINLL